MIFSGGSGEIGFRLKGVIETPFVDAGTVADVIDADGAVTTFPDQGSGRIEEFLFGITLALHARNLVDWLV